MGFSLKYGFFAGRFGFFEERNRNQTAEVGFWWKKSAVDRRSRSGWPVSDRFRSGLRVGQVTRYVWIALLLMTSPINLNCLKFNNQSSFFLSLFLTYHLLISTINPIFFLYLFLNSSSSFSQKKKKTHHLPTKQIANIYPINDFTIKFQLP